MYQQPKCPYSYFSLALEFNFRVLFPVRILKFSNVPAKLQRSTLPFIQISKIQFRYYFTGWKVLLLPQLLLLLPPLLLLHDFYTIFVTLWTFMKYIGALNVCVGTYPKLNVCKIVFTGNLVYPFQVVSSLSGNIITIISGWITSFVINNKTKPYINENEKSNIQILYSIMIPYQTYYVQTKSLAGAQPEIF